MTTTPAPHEGIGVSHYAWSTSPLRRYVDLVNQRQLIACVGQAPPYRAKDADLFAIVSGFEALYGAYADFQQRMERYWALRWLRQERVDRIGATVIKGDVLRVDGMPFITRLPGLPELPRGQRLELDVLGNQRDRPHARGPRASGAFGVDRGVTKARTPRPRKRRRARRPIVTPAMPARRPDADPRQPGGAPANRSSARRSRDR